MKRVLVTGAAGFIGSALCRHLAGCGWQVTACGRHAPERLEPGVTWRSYDLAWPSLPDGFLTGIDTVVHAAFVKQNYGANVRGTLRLLEACVAACVPQRLFLSSLAAHDGALSQYGRQKYELEQRFAAAGALVVRPGLVLGPGSIFASMCDYLRAHRFVPLIGGGNQPLQTVFVEDLTAAIGYGLERDLRGVFTVAEVEPVRYRRFYAALGERLGVRPRFVPVPFWAADAALAVAGAAGVRLPIDRDNLLGLRAMRTDRHPRLEAPGSPVGTFEENLRRALS